MHLQLAGQQVHLSYLAPALAGLHYRPYLRGDPQQILIGVLLVLQAAHQPAAGPAYLGGIERKPLLLRHLDGNRLKLPQEAGAAERSPADAQTAQHFRLVPYADLAQLDAGTEHPGQFLYQLAEIYPPIGGKVEEDLAAVKGVFHLHQLHFQLAQGYFLLRYAESLFLFFTVFLHPAQILLRGGTGHLFQGLYHTGLVHLPVGDSHRAAFGTAGGFHNHGLPHAVAAAIGVKVINFSDFLKSDADDLCHTNGTPLFPTSMMHEFSILVSACGGARFAVA